MKLNVILFDNFETLDAFGPVEIFGKLDKFFEIGYYSERGGIVASSQKVKVETQPFSEIEGFDLLLIPGGFGVRDHVSNKCLIEQLRELSMKSKYVLTVCTGSALLAKTGLLKGLKATSNKMSFHWVMEQDQQVEWVREARWVKDGKYYTSSGVSAGIDMALGFVNDVISEIAAVKVAQGIEYIWNNDSQNDPFAETSTNKL